MQSLASQNWQILEAFRFYPLAHGLFDTSKKFGHMIETV